MEEGFSGTILSSALPVHPPQLHDVGGVWDTHGAPHSMLVITINGSGLAIELAYVLLFLVYSRGKKRLQVLVVLVAETAFVALVALLVLTLAHTHEQRSMIVGILCVIFGTMMYAAPLSVMVQIIIIIS
uniref:Uncharacterized protein n=1 Tax=Ananas comosus var. bracteatus TaxID=296719 RepID=A0A6V7Q8R7_ANACO|nr:unnamed protein product [Ananas comosus var. bracteatus]